jgi:hypothetical protein
LVSFKKSFIDGDGYFVFLRVGISECFQRREIALDSKQPLELIQLAPVAGPNSTYHSIKSIEVPPSPPRPASILYGVDGGANAY